jgi:2-succinyl-6-hydroxy-2,4-cyclohexadiene-1-carboxylate synthase
MLSEVIRLENNLDVSVHMWGTEHSDTLVFLHGLGSTGRSFDEIASLLSKHYKIITIDLPGHGHSSFLNDEDFFSMEALGDWVMDTLNYFDINNFHIVGHSLGGYIGLVFSKKYPLQSLILLDGGYIQSSNLPENSLEEEIQSTRQHIETYTFDRWEDYEQELYNNGLRKNLIELSKTSMKSEDGKIKLVINSDVAKYLVKQMYHQPTDEILSKIHTSVLLLKSTVPEGLNSIRDRETSRLKQHLDLCVREVDEATHDIYWDQPGIVCDEIIKWINQYN